MSAKPEEEAFFCYFRIFLMTPSRNFLWHNWNETFLGLCCKIFFKGVFLGIFFCKIFLNGYFWGFFKVHYSTLLHLPPFLSTAVSDDAGIEPKTAATFGIGGQTL
jgi:hypothetical protein